MPDLATSLAVLALLLAGASLGIALSVRKRSASLRRRQRRLIARYRFPRGDAPPRVGGPRAARSPRRGRRAPPARSLPRPARRGTSCSTSSSGGRARASSSRWGPTTASPTPTTTSPSTSKTSSAPTPTACSATSPRARDRSRPPELVPTVSKNSLHRRLHLPGPTSSTASSASTDRNQNVLNNWQRILNTGRLGGTGYVSILPVDQGIEHSAGASFAPNPDYFDAEKIIELAIEGGCNAVASTFGVLGMCARKYAHKIPFLVKFNHNELMTYPNTVQPDPLRQHPPVLGDGRRRRRRDDLLRLRRVGRSDPVRRRHVRRGPRARHGHRPLVLPPQQRSRSTASTTTPPPTSPARPTTSAPPSRPTSSSRSSPRSTAGSTPSTPATPPTASSTRRSTPTSPAATRTAGAATRSTSAATRSSTSTWAASPSSTRAALPPARAT
jgi:hypothetical protein